jgi:signal transduction histidine kinase
VASSVALGAQLADEHSRASRLERESESFRRLSDALRSTGASFERDTVLEAALDATVATLGAAAAALCVLDAEGHVQIERSHGADFAPLLDDEDAETLLANMIGLGSLTVVDDLHVELPRAAAVAAAFRALAVVPVEAREHASLVVLMRAPDGAIESVDVRFLATLAGHLAVGLEKVRIHEELRTHRDRLEEEVSVRTASLRRVYDEIKSVDEMKDRFLANVSHEMLSPLTAIIGSASFLKDYRGERGDAEEMVSGILQSAHALERMVDGLLRVARVDTGDLAMVAAVTPADVIAEAVRLADADGRATIVIDPRIGTIPADPPRLARALGNLLDNALKFGPATESIELRVEPCWLGPEGDDRSGVSFAVLDGGPGLADGDEDRAFAPFEQGGDPLTGKPAGVGLGLYEARLIARRHGGTLEYAPRPEGGSEFRISLPAESAAARRAEQARGA